VTGSIKCEYVRAFPDHPSAKDFDLLRDADADLERRISQLSFLRLALVVILTFMFASALHRRNEGAIKNTLNELASNSTERSRHTRKLDPISTYLFRPDWYKDEGNFREQLTKLQAQYKEVFTVKFSALGTDLSFDLRLVIVSFPLWLPLVQIYVSILREKRRLIRCIGHALVERSACAEVTAMDLLIFGREDGPYRKYPANLMNLLFWALITALLTMMIWITDMRAFDEAPLLLKGGS